MRRCPPPTRYCTSARVKPRPCSRWLPASTRSSSSLPTTCTTLSIRRCTRRKSPSPWSDRMRRSDARAILHIDMDAFYASVEEQDRPELKGKPLIVGGTGGRGVLAPASYAVRRFGVHSAMPMREALRRCPEAIVVHPRMARYQEISQQVFAIFHEFTPLVEGLSLDEAFLDVTASRQLLGEPEEVGADIRLRIRAVTELTASVGIAPNKSLAK